MPVTVLELNSSNGEASGVAATTLMEHATASSEKDAPDIISKRPEAKAETAVQEESDKGYDLLLVGVEPALTAGGDIERRLMRIIDKFEGPCAIVLARGALARQPMATLDILAPVSGTDVSRRGSEIALALARATGASVRALHVPLGKQTTARRAGLGRLARGDRAIAACAASPNIMASK